MSNAANTASYPSVWRKPPFIKRSALRWAIYGGAHLYVIVAIGAIDVNWARLSEGAARGARLIPTFGDATSIAAWRASGGGARIVRSVKRTGRGKASDHGKFAALVHCRQKAVDSKGI